MISALAGAEPTTVVRLFLAMLAIQVSIGSLNDLVDAPLDARQKPRKPIPSGLVSRRAAGAVAGAGAGVGILLSAVSGPAAGVAGAACVSLGYAYDLRLSRTALSWLPLSLALPLLPIHAWLGAAGVIPTGLLTLVPVAVLGGAGLALANGLADVERDADAGRRTIVVALGPGLAWLTQTVVLATAAILALALAPVVQDAGVGEDIAVLRLLRVAGIWLGIASITLGSVMLRSYRAGLRERGWELEAVGVASLGVGWLAGAAATAAG